MAKAIKKKNRKLRRQIRKTIGALLMVSAITVAAIPVQDVSATPTGTGANETIKVAVTSDEGAIKSADATYGYESAVPYVKDAPTDKDKIIYTSGDGRFKFAFIRDVGAVILDYQDSQSNTTLEIPNQFEAYRSYASNYQDAAYYCLVSSNNELLGYKLQNAPLVDEATQQLKFMTSGREEYGVIKDIEVLRNQVEPNGDKWIYKYNKIEYGKKEDGSIDTDVIIETPAECEAVQMYGERYYPCFYDTRDTWKGFTDEELYYLPIDETTGEDQYGDWQEAKSDTNHWRIRANVAYIGAEKVEAVSSGSGWRLAGVRNTVGDGVFRNAFWIRELDIEAVLRGVADYAFYDCSQLARVEFKAGLETLGNGAFANCQALTEVIMPDARAIGKDAFYNCTALKKFDAPAGTLTHLGDCAFEGCTSLETVNFQRANGEPVPLQRLGNHIFWNCTALAGMEFPNGYFEQTAAGAVEPLDIDMFYGCTSLQYIKVPNTDSGSMIDFDTHHSSTTGYPRCTKNTWEQFRNTVPESFYVEGPTRSQIHTTANNNSLTYKYPNEQLYEKVVYEHDAVKDKGNLDGKSAKVFYKVRVDGNNVGKLEEFGILNYDGTTGTDNLSHPDIISIPEKVGTFGISSIEEGSFNNNCDLVKVTIPASVTSIGANAFKGCHELETVIFTDATQIQSIGTDAFRTQETISQCKHDLYPGTYTTDGIPLSKQGKYNAGDPIPRPKLYFVGTMLDENNNDTKTFEYATNGSSSINHRNSDDIYITCHSGWPTNMEVQYNYDPRTQTGEAQLVGYPRFADLSGNTHAWAEALPYVTNNSDIDYYANMIQRAIDFNAGNDISPSITPEEQAFLAATLNPVIPASIDSIKSGLFSGYDGNGNQIDMEGYYKGKDEDGNDKIYNSKGEPADPSYNFIPIETDTNIKTITLNGVNEVEPYTFKGCTGLTGADIIGSNLVDDYAFEDCKNLANVTLGSNLQDTGKRPFKGCDKLMAINCLDPSNFTFDGTGILYRNIEGGKEIVECLEHRGRTTDGIGSWNVGPEELAGVTSIKEEAFADCKDITQVDLSSTSVRSIPEGCFKDTLLNSIILSNGLTRINEGAFQNGGARRLMVYFKGDGNVIIVPDAFKNEDASKQQEVIFQCLENTLPYDYAKDYSYISTRDDEVYLEYNVRFWNPVEYPSKNNAVPLGPVQIVRSGQDAVPPATEDLKCNNEDLVFSGWDSEYTNITRDIDIYATYGAPEYTVTFIDGFDGSTLKIETVPRGGTAIPPADDELPEHQGQTFIGWDKPHYNITEDTTIVARYADSSGDLNRHKVSFYLTDDATEAWWETHVNDGDVVMAPMPPAREGYTFSRWLWAPASSATAVKQDTSVYAQWTTGSGSGNGSGSGTGSGSGSGSGSGNNGSNSSASPSASASPTATPVPGSDVKKYTVSVSGGSGSGSYAAGDIVAINAYYMGEGQVFDKWTSSTAGVGFSNPNATSATFTMPAANVAVTATYKTGNGTAAITPITNSSGGSSGTVNTVNNNGTTVDVTRPGISNTNLAGATVSGATDNFVVKVTEDQAATDAATAALQARFGDLSRIKYLPMDISLYDSTGRTKIADTSGITVNLTLPLPDDLVQYAGNNRIAAISNGALEDLNGRFTTVGGVPCVNFTATHFSPYVIYVDTANLTEATIDATPKTGDPIHPKWFLALGLACVSLILFFKRDRVVIKTKAA